jgi:hypothetical protein
LSSGTLLGHIVEVSGPTYPPRMHRFIVTHHPHPTTLAHKSHVSMSQVMFLARYGAPTRGRSRVGNGIASGADVCGTTVFTPAAACSGKEEGGTGGARGGRGGTWGTQRSTFDWM